MLKVDEITIKFGGLIAVNKVCFSISKGNIFGLIGPNGAGKTTLFNIISGVYAPSGGHIYLRDESITGLPPNRICERGISRTYQNINLFQRLTAMENVLIGQHKLIRSGIFSNILRTPSQRNEEKQILERCEAYLDFVNLLDKKDYLASSLSYGEQRRLEIARALSTEPQLILLDEPAAGMNSSEKVVLTGMIKKINEMGITVLLVEHDMKVIMNVTNNICVLNFGKKIAEGTPEEIQNNPEVIKAYLGGGLYGEEKECRS